MNKELRKKVNEIIKMGDDPEMAHIQEDELHLELIKQYCHEDVKKEVERLSKAKFSRWYA